MRTTLLATGLAVALLLGGVPVAIASATSVTSADAVAASALRSPTDDPDKDDPWPPPPGANNWSCRPSAQHPRPVVLVHGLVVNRFINWLAIAPQLAMKGYCVYAVTLGRNKALPPPANLAAGITSVKPAAKDLDVFVDKVLASTGAKKVDLLSHSWGTMVTGYYTKFLGPAKVDKWVGLTPFWRGLPLFGVSDLHQFGRLFGADLFLGLTLDQVCGFCREFLKDSAFQEELHRGGAAVPGVQYTNIMTKLDELAVPYTIGKLEGPDVTNIVLQDQCPGSPTEHFSIAVDPQAMRNIENALEGRSDEKAPCWTSGRPR